MENGIGAPKGMMNKMKQLLQKIKQADKEQALFAFLYRMEYVWRWFSLFGRCLHSNFGMFARFCKTASQRVGLFVSKHTARSFQGMKKSFARFGAGAANLFLLAGNAVSVVREEYEITSQLAPERSVPKRLLLTAKQQLAPPKKRKKFIVSICNYAVPVVAVVVAVNIFSGLLHTDYVLAVTYNGVELGCVADETVYASAAKNMQSRIIIPDEGETVSVDAELTVRALAAGEEVVSSAELTDRMMQNAEEEIVEADGIYIDGEFIGAVTELGAVTRYLNEKLERYKQENGYDEASYIKDIEVQKGYYIAANVISYDEVETLFESQEAADRYYDVVAGDTPLGIAAALDVDYKELLKLNPGIDEELYVGDKLLISASKPYLSIQAVTTQTYKTAVAYDTVEKETDALYIGKTKVKREGKKGVESVTAQITLVDGVETGREILSSEIIKKPVDEIVLVGTKEPDPVTVPAGITTHNENNTTGINLSWPTTGGYISSGFGSRWGSFHRAIDIAKVGGCYGDAIYAAADGRVTFVGYSGTYGRLIKISHGNGLETWYAHCSGYNVSTGDYVTRGDTIGYIGSSGRSTGPHLHFEVHLNGRYVNPLNYLK